MFSANRQIKTSVSLIGYLFNTISSGLSFLRKKPTHMLLLALYAQTQSIKAAMPTELAALNPTAYFPFNGNSLDESGHGNHAITYGARLEADRNGMENKAYLFNGSDYMVGNSKGLPDEERTVTFWFKPSYSPIGPDRDVGGTLLGYGGNGVCGTSFLIILNELSAAPANSYNIQSHCRVKNIDLIDSSLQGKDFSWMHFALTTKSGIGTKIYINNKQLLHDTAVYYDNTEVENAKFVFGAGVNPDGSVASLSVASPFYRGLLDDIIFLSYAASPEQVNILYNLKDSNDSTNENVNDDDEMSDLAQIGIGFSGGTASGILLVMLTYCCILSAKRLRHAKRDGVNNASDPFDHPMNLSHAGQDGYLEEQISKNIAVKNKFLKKSSNKDLQESLLESGQRDNSKQTGKQAGFFKQKKALPKGQRIAINLEEKSFRNWPATH